MDERRFPRATGVARRAEVISRRTLVKGAAAAGLIAAAGGDIPRLAGIARADAVDRPPMLDWQQFDAAVQAAMQTFGMVGAAVAVVNGQGTLHSNTFGVRDLDIGAPVTTSTLFRVGSTTKSMTSLLVATFVDDGTLAWDQPVVDAWPDFRAPTGELTQTLRVRDLMGMDSGLGVPDYDDLQLNYPTALELLRSIAFLPVLGPPHTLFFYNNPVYSAAGYLPPLMQGADPDALQSAYAQLMQERVYGPAGMRTARIADDPRPYTDDYATGHALDFIEGTAAEPWAATGSTAPGGGALASLTDMAAYVRTQLDQGVSPTGTPVASARNLVERWKPHIDVPVPATLNPDTVSASYGMGWIAQTYTDGRRLVWHNGSIDGFTTFLGFLPDDDLGLAVLTNVQLAPGGSPFYNYVLNLLLSGRFGLNVGVNDAVVSQYRDAEQRLLDQAAQAASVDPSAIAPYVGYYEHGYRLVFDPAGVLRIRLGARAFRVLAMPDNSYVAASGFLAGLPVRFSHDRSGNPLMNIAEAETVRWQSGPQ